RRARRRGRRVACVRRRPLRVGAAMIDRDGTPGSIGQPVTRVEDEHFLRGESRYVSDLIAKSGALRVAVLRSPHAHARLLAVDVTRARALPGVVDVLTPTTWRVSATSPATGSRPGWTWSHSIRCSRGIACGTSGRRSRRWRRTPCTPRR